MSEYIKTSATIMEATKLLEDQAKILIDGFFDALEKVATSHGYTETRRWRDENTESQLLAKCQYEKKPGPKKGIERLHYVMVVASIGGPKDPNLYGHKMRVSLLGSTPKGEPLELNLNLNRPEEGFNTFLKQYDRILRKQQRAN